MPESPDILIIAGEWPGRNHPYLIWLFGLLKSDFSNLRLMLFSRTDKRYGYESIGRKKTDRVLNDCLYRQPYTLNPFIHLKVWLRMLIYFRHTFSIARECRQNGLTLAQVYGQFLYYHPLLGKQFDLVHINALQTAYHIKAKAWFGKAKVIVSSRGQDFDFFPDKYDDALTRADHVHVLGKYLQAKVLSKGFSQTDITMIPPSYIPDSSIITGARELSDRTIHIATAARLYWTKGFRYALRTIHRLVQQGADIHYHIYGEGEQADELIYLVRQLQLTDHITFHGWIEESLLKKELSQHDLYMLLSVEEAYNNSVILAQSLGLPCIVSEAGGLPENVSHGQTGLVVPAYDHDQAASAIIKLTSERSLYNEMSRAAIRKVQSLSINTQVKAYGNMYRQLLTS